MEERSVERNHPFGLATVWGQVSRDCLGPCDSVTIPRLRGSGLSEVELGSSTHGQARSFGPNPLD